MTGEQTSSTTCRICAQPAAGIDTGRVIRGYNLSACSACGTVHVQDQPDPEELKRTYDELFSHGEYEQHRADFETLKSGRKPPNLARLQLLRKIEKMIGARRLIELGGGTGLFGTLARSRGWHYKNYDISPIAIEFCRQLDLDAEFFPAGDVPPLHEDSADLIVMWEVVEHIWNVSGYLEVVRKALSPGGVLMVRGGLA